MRDSPRPKGDYTPEEWRALPPKERDVIIRRERLREESEKLDRERKKRLQKRKKVKRSQRRGEREREAKMEARMLLSARIHPTVKGKTRRPVGYPLIAWIVPSRWKARRTRAPVGDLRTRWSAPFTWSKKGLHADRVYSA